MTDTAVIEVRSLHKAYGDIEVLKGVDLFAKRGEVISLIGSSGSGKSTLLRCVNLLENSQDGDISFEGEDVSWKGSAHTRCSADANQVIRIRTNLAMVFQQFNLWSHMTILQNVMEAPLTVQKRALSEVEPAARGYLEKVGIGDKCDRYPAELSGGQQQRLCIARAVATEPEVLLMDEPCSALDPIATGQVEELIDELRTNYSVVIVTHSMQQAARVSQKTAFFHLGNLVEYGSTGDIFTKPEDPRTESYITGRIG